MNASDFSDDCSIISEEEFCLRNTKSFYDEINENVITSKRFFTLNFRSGFNTDLFFK